LLLQLQFPKNISLYFSNGRPLVQIIHQSFY
jgi:hypothetical protein